MVSGIGTKYYSSKVAELHPATNDFRLSYGDEPGEGGVGGGRRKHA